MIIKTILIIWALVMSILLFRSEITHRTPKHTCSVTVRSEKTGRKYYASAYRITHYDEMQVRIYNGAKGRYEWRPIWDFTNPFVTAYCVDKEWAMRKWQYLITPYNK